MVYLAAGPRLTITKKLTCTKCCAIGHDRMFTLANSEQANKKFNVTSREQLLCTSR